MSSNISRFNEVVREIRGIIREMYGENPPFNEYLVAQRIARVYDEIEAKGLDVKQIINDIADHWDATLSRGEQAELVDEILRKYVPEAFIGEEVLSELDELRQTLGWLESKKMEIEEEIRELGEDSPEAVRLSIDLKSIQEEIEKTRRRIAELEAKARPRRRPRRRKKPRITEKVEIRRPAQPAQPAKPARPARRRRAKPTTPVVLKSGLERLFEAPETVKYGFLSEIDRLKDRVIRELRVAPSLLQVFMESEYFRYMLGKKKPPEVKTVEDMRKEIENASKKIDYYIWHYTRGLIPRTRKVDIVEDLGRTLGRLYYLAATAIARDMLNRVRRLLQEERYTEAADLFDEVRRKYGVPRELTGMVLSLASLAAEAVRQGRATRDELEPILEEAESLGVKTPRYPPEVSEILRATRNFTPCSRAEYYVERYPMASSRFARMAAELCMAIREGRPVEARRLNEIRNSLAELPSWEAEMLGQILSSYEEEMASLPEKPPRAEAIEARPAEKKEKVEVTVTGMLPEPKIEARRFEVEERIYTGGKVETVKKVYIENDLDEYTYHTLCQIMGLPPDIFASLPPSIKYARYCPIQYYIEKDLKRGTFHMYFPVYGPRVVEWARRVKEMIERAIVSGQLPATIWLNENCKKWAEHELRFIRR